MRVLLFATLALLLVAVLGSPAHAAWPHSPFTNLPLCTAGGDQEAPMIVSDGAGGAIVTWQDQRGGNFDIYARHVLASGAVDPAWPIDGRALCTAPNDQISPAIVSDGTGGAIVAWVDLRNGNDADIYARHVMGSGVVDPAWPVDGRALCTAGNDQYGLRLVSDGSGGAIVTWVDLRSAVDADVYAQHVLATGAVDPAWPSGGRALCTAGGEQDLPRILSDGVGGAIVTWNDKRSGTADIYAQRVLISGAVDPAWPGDGRTLCTAANDQVSPAIVSDGAGGAIVTWADRRSAAYFDIYAQHLLASGVVDPVWPADGQGLCTAQNDQASPAIVSDGAGGAIVTWTDRRSLDYLDIYAQRLLASGAVDPVWPANGRALCATGYDQDFPTIVSDDAGGAIVTWHDYRGGAQFDIYLQHVLASGEVDPASPTDGRALCAVPGDQELPQITPDGTGGAIVTWQDHRGANYDIYAQRVARYGYLGSPEAEIVSVKDVARDQGGWVNLSWKASYLEDDPYDLVTQYKLFRSVPPASDLPTSVAGATTYVWEYVATVSADFLTNYSHPVPTTGDSTAAGIPTTAYMVQSLTAGGLHWESLPTNGYSVDNLAPATPALFTGEYVAGTTYQHWDPNTEADLAGYRLYRGTPTTFVPGPGNLVAELHGTSYADGAGVRYVYKLTAVDVHGNESAAATLIPAGTVAVEERGLPREAWLAAPWPNPAGEGTTLRYGLPRGERVRLAIYDAEGRLVRELVRAVRGAGEQREVWDLRDGGGRAVRAGLYFEELEVEGRALVRRVAVAR